MSVWSRARRRPCKICCYRQMVEVLYWGKDRSRNGDSPTWCRTGDEKARTSTWNSVQVPSSWCQLVWTMLLEWSFRFQNMSPWIPWCSVSNKDFQITRRCTSVLGATSEYRWRDNRKFSLFGCQRNFSSGSSLLLSFVTWSVI
jgi:hypothetical protein